jgi:hypothetical protein
MGQNTIPEDEPMQAVELSPTNYLDLAFQRLLDNPSHYATSATGFVCMLVVAVVIYMRDRARKSP